MKPTGELKPASRRNDRFDYAVHPTAGDAPPARVWVAKDLGAAGMRLLMDLTNDVRDLGKDLSQWFGNCEMPPHNVVIAPIGVAGDGSGGTYLRGGMTRTLYIDADVRSLNARDRVAALYVGGASSMLQALTPFGWYPDSPAGEALAWTHANAACEGALPEWERQEQWLDSDRTSFLAFEPAAANEHKAVGEAQLYFQWLTLRPKTVAEMTCVPHKGLADHCQRLLGRGHSVIEFSQWVEERWPRPRPSSVVTVGATPAALPETSPVPAGTDVLGDQHHALELWSATPAGYYVRVPADLAGDLGVNVERWKEAWEMLRTHLRPKATS
jgi:hypothetical protein